MKKLIVVSAVSFILAAAVNANATPVSSIFNLRKHDRTESVARKEKKEERKELRKLEGQQVSYQSKQQFYIDFGMPITGSRRTGMYDEIYFNSNGVPTTAYYNVESNLIGTSSNKKFSDLPLSAQKHILSKYKGYKVENVLFFDDNSLNETDMILYKLSFEDEDNYFVELKKDNKEIILQVNMDGNTSLFKEM